MSAAHDKHVAEIVNEMESGSLVTKYVVIAEAMDSDGNIALFTTANDKARSWDILGLLHFAVAKEEAQINRMRPRED